MFLISRNKISKRKLSLFLSDVLDKTHIWWNTRRKYLVPYMRFEEWLTGEVYGKGIVSVYYVGSYRETIASLHYADTSSDIDIMYIYRNFDVDGKRQFNENLLKDDASVKVELNTMIIDSHIPGYVYIKLIKPVADVVENFKRIAMKGEFHMSLEVEQLVEYFEKNVICSVNDLVGNNEKRNLRGSFMKSDAFITMHEMFNRERFAGWLLFQQCGPASKVFWNVSGLPQRIKISPLDMVFALHSPDWPNQATEWLSRKRKFGYPSRQLIREIENYGVDVVAKSSDTGMELEWRLSFSIAEVKLVEKWNGMQKSCYRIFKTFHTDYLSHLGITSYSIKNIMFYLIERTNPGIWKPTKLVKCLFLAIKSLKSALASKFCPHYFIKKNNLFRGIREKQLKKAALVCDALLSDIYGQILLSDGLWYEICARGMERYLYSVQESGNEWRLIHQSHVKSRSEWTDNFDKLFKIYYSAKVHKEVSRMFLNAPLSKHYEEKTVLKALNEFIASKKVISDAIIDSANGLVFCQVTWAYMKCLHWCNRLTRRQNHGTVTYGELHLNDVQACVTDDWVTQTDEPRPLEDSYGRKFTRNELIFATMELVNTKYANRIKIAHQILLGNEVDEKEANARMNDSCNIPIVVCPLDSKSKDKTIADYPYKHLSYYCPFNQLIVYECLRNGKKISREQQQNASLKELKELLGQVYIQQFHTIIHPFAKYLNSKIENMMEHETI